MFWKKVQVMAILFLVTIATGCGSKEEPQQTENSVIEETRAADPTDNSVDIITRYNLPSLSRMDTTDQEKYVDSLQVMKKIAKLNLSEEDFVYPEKSMEQVMSVNAEKQEDLVCYFSDRVLFDGDTSAKLQQCINDNPGKEIFIESKQVIFTNSISVPSNVYINGNGVNIATNSEVKNAFLVENADNVILEGFNLNGGFQYGIYVIDSQNIEIRACDIWGLTQKAIVTIGNCKHIRINDNRFIENQCGAIYFDGDISLGEITNNEIKNSRGTSNWMAGIVLCGVGIQDKADIWELFDENHHFPKKDTLYSEIDCPHDIVVADNLVENNQASGIYCDGAYRCYLTGNRVRDNDKEGICLDYGSFGCYLYGNTFERNGRRGNQTDKDLEMDFVLEGGRLEDGSAKAKLPAISLDNTAYNVLVNNTVSNNYGGGIKMVRTTVRCMIAENIVKNNNMGASEAYHFFGIEVGSAIADAESTEMDFTADYENIICRNLISGNHYSGVFIGEGGYVNDVFDNVIMQTQMFSVESVSTMFNSIVNNIADRDVRNEYIG